MKVTPRRTPLTGRKNGEGGAPSGPGQNSRGGEKTPLQQQHGRQSPDPRDIRQDGCRRRAGQKDSDQNSSLVHGVPMAFADANPKRDAGTAHERGKEAAEFDVADGVDASCDGDQHDTHASLRIRTDQRLDDTARQSFRLGAGHSLDGFGRADGRLGHDVPSKMDFSNSKTHNMVCFNPRGTSLTASYSERRLVPGIGGILKEWRSRASDLAPATS